LDSLIREENIEKKRGETSSNHLKQPHLSKYSPYLAILLSPSHGETLDPIKKYLKMSKRAQKEALEASTNLS